MPITSNLSVSSALAQYAANNNTSPMSIADTGSNIATNFDQLNAIAAKITQLNATTPLKISIAQYTKDAAIISKLATTSSVTVFNVTKTNIAEVLKNTKYIDNVIVTTTVNDINIHKSAINSAITIAHSAIKISGFTINDTFLTVSQNINKINSLGVSLNNIVLTDAKPTLKFSVSSGQFVNASKVIDFILKQGPTLSVFDTANNIAANFDKLNLNAKKIVDGILISDQTRLSITVNQLSTDTAALNLLKGNYTLEITKAPVNFIAPVTYASKITGLSVLDSSANITKNLTVLNALGTKLTGINVSDISNPLKLTYNQLISNAALLAKVQSAYALSISDASILNLTKITATNSVKFAVNTDVYLLDTSTNVHTNLVKLETLFNTSNLINLKGIKLSDLSTPTFNITSAQYFDNADILNLITSPYSLKVSGVITDDLATLLKNPHVTSVAINDTADSVALAFNALNTNANKITGITINLSDTVKAYPIALTAQQFIADTAALKLLTGIYTLDITNSPANFKTLANYTTYASHITSFSVKDTSANIISNLDALQTLNAKLTDITQTNPSNTPLQITAAQLSADLGVLNKISTNFSVNVSNVLAANVEPVLNNTNFNFLINAVSVSDTNANIKAKLNILESNISSINTITIKDNSFTMAITPDQLFNDIDVLNKLSKTNSSMVFNVDLPVLTPSTLFSDVDGANGHINFILHPKSTDTPSGTNFGNIPHFTGQDKISFTSGSTAIPLTLKGNIATATAGVAHIDTTTGIASFNDADSTLDLQITAIEKALSPSSATQGNVAFWQNGTDSYVFISDATTGVSAGDNLIQLTGIIDVSHLHLVNGAISYV